MEIWANGESLLQQKGCPETRLSHQAIAIKEREEGQVRLIREGLFWRIITPIGVSKQRFLTKRSAQKCIDMQDKHGVPVIKYNRKEKNGFSKRHSR